MEFLCHVISSKHNVQDSLGARGIGLVEIQSTVDLSKQESGSSFKTLITNISTPSPPIQCYYGDCFIGTIYMVLK